MITRKWKITSVVCVFLTLLYIHSGDNRLFQEYRQSMQRQIDSLVERSRLQSDSHSQSFIKIPNQPNLNPSLKGKIERGDDDSASGTSMPQSVVIEEAFESSEMEIDVKGLGELFSNSGDVKPVREKLKTDIVFPSVSNCSKKEYNLMLKNHKGPTVPTRDVYPCKKWNKPSSNDQVWPIVIKATGGKILNQINLNKVNKKVRDRVKEQMVVQQERVERLRNTCNKYPELAIRQNLVLVWDTKTEPPVVYCPLYKVASTTWMVYFLRLAHVNDDNPRLEIYNKSGKERKKYMPRFGGGHQRVFKEFKAPATSAERSEIFQKSLRFIVVRHPFTRLLSAFRDKMERPNPRPFSPYFKDLQRAIIMKYREVGSNVTSTIPTFSEFVDFVVDSTENLKTAQDWEENVLCWSTYWSQCGVCSADFQVVIKLETMDDDEQFLAHVANLKEIQNVHEWRNLKRTSVSSTALLPKYYGSLTKQQIHKLYERYKVDFELFGYTLDEYL